MLNRRGHNITAYGPGQTVPHVLVSIQTPHFNPSTHHIGSLSTRAHRGLSACHTQGQNAHRAADPRDGDWATFFKQFDQRSCSSVQKQPPSPDRWDGPLVPCHTYATPFTRRARTYQLPLLTGNELEDWANSFHWPEALPVPSLQNDQCLQSWPFIWQREPK